MKWRARSVKNISLVLILIFIIVRLTGLAWNSPFYTTPTEKTFNVIKLYGVGLVLGEAEIAHGTRHVGLEGGVKTVFLVVHLAV